MTKNKGAVPVASQQKGAADISIVRDRQKDSDRATRWRTVGCAQRYGDGIRFAILFGSLEGEYAISADSARRLLVENALEVPLWQLRSEAGPEPCGTAKRSRTRRMIVLDIPGAGREGALQLSSAHITAHWLRGEKTGVPVVAPPEPRLVAGGIPA